MRVMSLSYAGERSLIGTHCNVPGYVKRVVPHHEYIVLIAAGDNAAILNSYALPVSISEIFTKKDDSIFVVLPCFILFTFLVAGKHQGRTLAEMHMAMMSSGHLTR